jgi:hypothetical protein
LEIAEIVRLQRLALTGINQSRDFRALFAHPVRLEGLGVYVHKGI